MLSALENNKAGERIGNAGKGGGRRSGKTSLTRIRYSIGNRVQNIIITMKSDKRLLDLLWWSLCKVYKY